MLIRVIVLLLVTLNLAAAAWIVSTYPAPTAPAVIQEDGTPRLVLLSEVDDDVPAQDVIPQPQLAAADEACTSLGPFSSQAELRSAMSSLTPLTRRIQYREALLAQSRGWWVYLPPFATRELALEAARDLSTKGVKDYYVISAGDQQNTISLGLFRERANAEQRHAQLTGLNLNPMLGERTEQAPVYWIDFAQAGSAMVDWRARLAASSSLTENRIDCF